MMDVNDFIMKLKADDTERNLDLVNVYKEYNVILGQIASKDRALFALNVLCIMCRNLDKVPKWRDSIDNKALLTLSIDCVRETRAMERPNRVKTLACLYHIHRHIVKQETPLPPELVLKMSFMPFEVDVKHLLHEYSKTYWNILVDRLSYIERMKTKIPIIKHLPKLTEDIVKVIEIYDSVQFCNNILLYLVRKLSFMYSEKYAKDLNITYSQIFQKISLLDTKPFKTLTNKETMDIYLKLNECLAVIAQNASKTSFKDSPLDNVVRTCISIVGHSSDLFHCLQTFYSNSFCSLLTAYTNLNYSETVLNSLLLSCDTADKLGYGRAMLATYPYLSQFLRLYIEFNMSSSATRPWKENFNTPIQLVCLKLMFIFMKRLEHCNQRDKCDDCPARTGLHDALRLSYIIKNFITVAISQNMPITDIQPALHSIITSQYKILADLQKLECVNYGYYYRKLQTDVHNTAINLNKVHYYEFSIQLFDIYLKSEIKDGEGYKNVSRGLYNKSICELDIKLYKNALINAYLSMVFSDGQSSEKYMGLVMDVKAKALKRDPADDEEPEDLQLFSVLDACKVAQDDLMYGDIGLFLKSIKFCDLMMQEFILYAKVWPSANSIAGVWKSLLGLSKGKYEFAANEDVSWTMYEIVLETATIVRAIYNENFRVVLDELLEDFDGKTLSPDLKVVYASLLFLKTEYNLSEASQKYGWKSTEPKLDPDQVPANRTVSQEYAASRPAVQAMLLLTELSSHFDTVTHTQCLKHSLQIYQVLVMELLYLSRDVEGLQLAFVCCAIAERVGDDEAYVRNAGTLLYHGAASSQLDAILALAAGKCKGVAVETSVAFICNASIYYSKIGSLGVAAKLVQLAQTRILTAYKMEPNINVELAVGRLLDAQAQLCKDTGPSTLSVVNGIQRHYLSIVSASSKWSIRRYRSLSVLVHVEKASLQAATVARALGLWRRALAAATVALPPSAAVTRAALYAQITDVSDFDDAQVKIDNRLKYVLGMQLSNETPALNTASEVKTQPFTPKQDIEMMLESVLLKKSQTSPSLPTTVPGFKPPAFLEHGEKCDCYYCSIPICLILACQTNGLEASLYFRANETEIARNYFNGVLRMFDLIEVSLKRAKNRFMQCYDEFIVKSVMKSYSEVYRRVKVGILIELAFFELKCEDYGSASARIVEIHEVMEATSDPYLSNEIVNLMMCSAQLQENLKRPPDIDLLDLEFDSLRLSPVKYTEPSVTPITKRLKPPRTAAKVIVNDEDLPKKCRVIKLNLDDGNSDEEPKKNHEFKIPVPVTRHVLEAATPITGSKPNILVTQPSVDTSPKTQFFTPKETPEQFFTPVTSIKTYKKPVGLRRNIVKNLEQEFSASISTEDENQSSMNEHKENAKATLQVPKKSKKRDVKRSLKRATSPGKLCKEQKAVTRSSRLRKPINFSIDDDDGR